MSAQLRLSFVGTEVGRRKLHRSSHEGHFSALDSYSYSLQPEPEESAKHCKTVREIQIPHITNDFITNCWRKQTRLTVQERLEKGIRLGIEINWLYNKYYHEPRGNSAHLSLLTSSGFYDPITTHQAKYIFWSCASFPTLKN